MKRFTVWLALIAFFGLAAYGQTGTVTDSIAARAAAITAGVSENE